MGGYRSLHLWVERNLGKPMQCENCSTTYPQRYHWANISGEYKRELSDWVRLCPLCHKNYDNQNICKARLHLLTDNNLYIAPKSGIRECLACRRASRKKYYWSVQKGILV
jgi:hypothetical protein